jgi:phenylacetate-coenzyme A ligase PaaK-like adenylate-forming protein
MPPVIARALRPLVDRTLARRYALLRTKQERYTRAWTVEEIAAFQIERFNAAWSAAVGRYRFYAEWKRRHGLPARIADLAEVRGFPILRKADVQEAEASIRADAGHAGVAITGGSTGEPCRFPVDAHDLDVEYANMYLGRSWWSVHPLDPVVLIWGHGHLFKGPVAGRFKWLARRVRDALINTVRLNAYNLGPETVAGYFSTLCRRPGSTVVSYASAFSKLLDYLDDSGEDPRRARVRNVILTSELTFPGDFDRIRRHFGVEPVIEYGMAETGPIAYSQGACDHLVVFWDSFHTYLTSEQEIVVSTLWDRRFPLINYGTGDLAEVNGGSDAPSLLTCRAILGRVHETVDVPRLAGSVTTCHSNLFMAILAQINGVRSFMIVQSEGKVSVLVKLAPSADMSEVRRLFLERLRREIPDVVEAAFVFELLRDEVRTLAGKRRFVLRTGTSAAPAPGASSAGRERLAAAR